MTKREPFRIYFQLNYQHKATQWGILLLLAFLWGSAFIFQKKALEGFSPDHVAAIRVSIAFLLLSPLAFQSLKGLRKQFIVSFLVIGLVGITIPAFFFAFAQTRVDSGITGALNSLTPLFTLIISVVFYKSKVRYYNIIGIIVGLTGALGLLTGGSVKIFAKMDIYGLLIVVATICYGINVNEIKKVREHLSGLQVISLAYLVAFPFVLGYLVFNGPDFFSMTSLQLKSLGYVGMLALFSSVLASTGFIIFIRYVSPVFASSVTYLIPVFALLWGKLDGENIGWVQFLFIFIILGGVYLVNKK